jgi:hypothetical protein
VTKSPSHQPGANLLPLIRRYRLPFAVMLSAAFICSSAQLINAAKKAPLAPNLVLVDDSIISEPLLAIADGRVTGDGLPPNLTLDDLQRISLPDVDDFPRTNAIADVFLRGNSHFRPSAITIASDKARIEWWAGRPMVMPIDLLRAIRIDLANDSPDFAKSLASPPADQDRLFINGDEGQISVVSGLVESLQAEVCKIEVGGQVRSVLRNKIFGVVFAQPVPDNKLAQCTVSFRDRSQFSGDKLSLSGGKATLALGPDAEVQFDWSAVDSVSIRSTRLAYLSNLPFIKEEQTPIVTPPFPAQRDKSVSGSRLQVGPMERFDKGLGVHARSSLTFGLDGQWDTFVAKIGLDAEADGKGDCIFQVLADGKSIFQRRMTGRDLGAAEVKLPITGCQELTLLVEPGEGLDLADHANWCDARLTKAKR